MATVAEVLRLAIQHHQAGDLQRAEGIYREVLRTFPDQPDALELLGMLASQTGRHDVGIELMQRALALAPGSAGLHSNLGLAYQGLGKPADAVACFQEALRLKPAFPEACFNLGNAFRESGNLAEAAGCYREALRLRPDYAEALGNLGVTLNDQGHVDEAIDCYRRALTIRPGNVAVLVNCGNCFKSQGRPTQAADLYRKALALDPGNGGVHHSLGCALDELGQFDEAADCYRQAIACEPALAEAHRNLGSLLNQRGLTAEAAACLGNAFRLQPTDRNRVLAATLLPPVYPSPEAKRQSRSDLIADIRRMRGDGVRVDVTREAAPTLFYLTYQGLNDRDILREYGELFEAPPDQGPKPRPGRPGVNRKIHVGFLSSHFRNHTVGELMRGLIAHLCRDRFVVHVLTVGHYDDEVARFLRQHADFSIEVTTNLPAARRTIAELGLDVLFYADIGMDPVTSTLALSRLAPVQCTTWGHPSTSGLPTIDYFLSSELFETENADDHYTEKLVRLRTIPAYCCRPEQVTLRAGPEDFGLPADCRLYACPQSLFKIDPDFDDILGRLLRRDPRGIVTFHRYPGRNWHELLSRRFAARIPDVADRIRFLPRLVHADYLRLNTAAAALLDPTAFNGGNTSYKGLALGTPIVTLPGDLLRSRMTLAMYRKMGVMDCVANSPEEYVEIAVHLAEDSAHRNAVRANILAANDVLYEDREAVSELDRFLQEAVAAPSSD